MGTSPFFMRQIAICLTSPDCRITWAIGAGSVSRRAMVTDHFLLGDWNIDVGFNELKRRNQRVRVEPTVMQVLVCLARNQGSMVSGLLL
jgi:DNA-binding response OmpR family regulator